MVSPYTLPPISLLSVSIPISTWKSNDLIYRSSNGNQRDLLRSAFTMLLRKDKMQTCVCVCVCVCVRVRVRVRVRKVTGRRHIKGFRRQFKKSFRHCEWRRLHIRNLLIFICLQPLGLRRCEDKLSNDRIFNLK